MPPRDHAEGGVAGLVSGRYIEEDQLVGPFGIVARGLVNWVTGVPE
jgi:hypothetical protein